MVTLLLILHVLVCFFLIFIVLVQGGKGAELGAAFGGGSSQTLFGGRGAGTFLGKLTAAAAFIFLVSSLLFSIAAKQNASVVSGRTVKEAPAQQAPADQTAPQAPSSTPAPAETPAK